MSFNILEEDLIRRNKIRKTLKIGIPIILVLVVVGAMCCAQPMYNLPLLPESEAVKQAKVSILEPIQQDDATLMFIALSGGGSRATCMSWEFLKQLKSIPY